MANDNGTCDWESTVVVVHEWGGEKSLERSIVEGIVDLCSADGQVHPDPDEAERVQMIDRVFTETHLLGGELQVTYAGYEVAVKSNGVVRIEDSSDDD